MGNSLALKCVYLFQNFFLSKQSFPPIVPPIKQSQTEFLGLFLYLLNTFVFMRSVLQEKHSLKLAVLF